MKRDLGLNLIIGYKAVRASLALLAAIAGLVLLLAGLASRVHDAVAAAHDHAASALALNLTQLVATTLEPRHMAIAAGAVALDGVVMLLEAWALYRGWKWGAWLVVGATSLFVPFEVVALVRELSVPRALLLLVNGAIVAWLLQHAVRQHRAP